MTNTRIGRKGEWREPWNTGERAVRDGAAVKYKTLSNVSGTIQRIKYDNEPGPKKGGEGKEERGKRTEKLGFYAVVVGGRASMR